MQLNLLNNEVISEVQNLCSIKKSQLEFIEYLFAWRLLNQLLLLDQLLLKEFQCKSSKIAPKYLIKFLT